MLCLFVIKGEGQYGKVYTCINVDTGELMAMKEVRIQARIIQFSKRLLRSSGSSFTLFFFAFNQIRFQPNDHKTIKETADELKIFEGIKHPNLVRYFGVELHRVRGKRHCEFRHHVVRTEAVLYKLQCAHLQEEMYIFMEYCDEGTLEEVSRLGLQEHVIRLYSKQITTAINVLHEHGIVHRDIKGQCCLHFLSSSFTQPFQGGFCAPFPHLAICIKVTGADWGVGWVWPFSVTEERLSSREINRCIINGFSQLCHIIIVRIFRQFICHLITSCKQGLPSGQGTKESSDYEIHVLVSNPNPNTTQC